MPTPETTGAVGGSGNRNEALFDDAGSDISFNEAMDPFLEVGLTGLRRSAGHIQEEFLPQLAGFRAHQMYREMRDNDPVIGAILYAIDRLIRQVSWRVQANSKSVKDEQSAKFVVKSATDLAVNINLP